MLTYPLRTAVTRTAIRAPRSAARSRYVAFVAPAIFFPERSHWYRTFAAGLHVPARAVSVRPTRTVPETFGRGAERNRAPGTARAAETFDVVAYPARRAVTRTEILRPRSAAVTVYVERVAPEIDLPSRSHR